MYYYNPCQEENTNGFPLKLIYFYDIAVNGGTKCRNETGLFSLPKVVKRNYEGDRGFDENKQITH
jgi:hypothetical protein